MLGSCCFSRQTLITDSFFTLYTFLFKVQMFKISKKVKTHSAFRRVSQLEPTSQSANQQQKFFKTNQQRNNSNFIHATFTTTYHACIDMSKRNDLKGQLISKQDFRVVTSPKKQTKRTQDTILSVFRSFLGEVTARQLCFEIY